MSGDVDGEVSERMMRRWRVISVAKYARWRKPVEESLEFGEPPVDEESILKQAGSAANQSLSFSCTGLASWSTRCVPCAPAAVTVVIACSV